MLLETLKEIKKLQGFSFEVVKKMPAEQIQYSEKYFDDMYEYRHVILPPDLTKHVPKSHLMTETEWRNLGIQQSPGWVHYMMHSPEPHVILFRRHRETPWKHSQCHVAENKETQSAS